MVGLKGSSQALKRVRKVNFGLFKHFTPSLSALEVPIWSPPARPVKLILLVKLGVIVKKQKIENYVFFFKIMFYYY